MRNYTVGDLLEAREKRVQQIEQLIKGYGNPLLALRVNYPGLKKTNELTMTIIREMGELLSSMFELKLAYKTLRQGAEGPIFMAVVQKDVFALKKLAVEFEENHVLGRCLDLDVYDHSGRSVSRQELGYPKRKCYLCEDYAQHCVRARRHPEHEVIHYIEEKFRNYRGLKVSTALNAKI
ncbi:citrate lyase holo-[acyl-carrier protein] synthase [Desulfosporosinus meridiei]|uniref:citrate lyase holo-[acyl-carrier protein] synthase n=1 Tax=Desulfosporosinus meridiei (strain ATCC BAA-275 / DSM 13257 / KCTC 12902 / NCIMB 13706 / S10) TaxID=768704 RepID=J7IW46_DESMD|nr:citrate lyase holo-[acyl-carrier protein] synthase [Desulfosporosinus meridiei]AFQ46072.1 holo-ACP synthase CitX [Desulfosporosinus meridiei DSM 13257]